MRDNCSAFGSISDCPGNIAGRNREPGLRDRFIATDMIAMRMRVDDNSNRLVSQRCDRIENLVAELSKLRIDDDCALLADLLVAPALVAVASKPSDRPAD